MQKYDEIIAETVYQDGAGGDIDGATIFVDIGKWCAERIFVEVSSYRIVAGVVGTGCALARIFRIFRGHADKAARRVFCAGA